MWSIASEQRSEWKRVESESGGANRDYPAPLYMDYLIYGVETFIIPNLDVKHEGSVRSGNLFRGG